MANKAKPKKPPSTRAQKLKHLPINKLLPTMLTTLALCAGLTAIRFAMDGRYQAAVIAIVLAGIFDGLDGRIARLLGAESKFGAEFDSLSDVISFGVAPAFLVYQWSLTNLGTVGWLAVLAYAVCTAFRLARFNTMLDESPAPAWAQKSYFMGVPAPAGAGLAILPIVLSFELDHYVWLPPFLMAGWIATVGVMMISRLPTFSFKELRVPIPWVLPSLIILGLLAAAFVSSPWWTLSGVIILYLISIPLGYLQFKKRSKSKVPLPSTPSDA